MVARPGHQIDPSSQTRDPSLDGACTRRARWEVYWCGAGKLTLKTRALFYCGIYYNSHRYYECPRSQTLLLGLIHFLPLHSRLTGRRKP